MSEKDSREEELLDLETVMKLPAGRRVLHRFMIYTGLDNDVYESNTHDHARNAGRREVGIFMREEMKEASPGKYLEMLKENMDE